MSAAEETIRGAFHDALDLLETSRSVTHFANGIKRFVLAEKRKQEEHGKKRVYNGNFKGFKE